MTREQRKLAVILAADVVGYSRLMGRDESGTLARLREHRKERFEPILARYGGRVVKLTDDGALVQFTSAVDALSAAIAFQQAVAEINKSDPDAERIIFRVGLHLVDPIVDGDDLNGDGVNVAARLGAEATPGGIIVSGAIKEATVGRCKAVFEDLGRLTLKNIGPPVQPFDVKWLGADWEQRAEFSTVTSDVSILNSPAKHAEKMRRSIEQLGRKLHAWHDERRFHAALVRVAFAVGLFIADPFGISNQKSHAIDSAFAWLVGNWQSYQPSDRLAVVLIGEEDLRSSSFQTDWPISYGKTASIVRLLACAGASGIFFDYTGSHQFNLAEGREDLEAMVLNSSEAPQCNDNMPPPRIPVYFGAAEGADAPFARFLIAKERAFWIGANAGEGIYSSGRAEFPTEPLAMAKDQSPAFGIARSLCRFSSGADLCPSQRVARAAQPLRLVWTANISSEQHYFLRASPGMECREALTLWDKTKLLVGLTDVGRYQPCPPILTLVARQLFLGDPTHFLKGRFVFVGTDLFGLNDTVLSPVHGNLPGVYAHAVALDNLWHFKEEYPTLPEPYILWLVAAVIYIAIELTLEVCRGFSYSSEVRRVVLVVAVAALAGIVVYNHWPYSLILAILGYYGGSLGSFMLINVVQKGKAAQ